MKARLDERGVIVQPGDMIARRFRLVRTEEYDIPGATRFVAYDTRLDQDVTVDIVSSVAPTAVVRAAHRAQVVRDRRLTRILAANSERRGGDRLTAVTTLDADAVTADDLPADLTDSARDLCEALLRGSGPLTLAQITGALGTGETAGLRALVAEAPTLWWSPAPEVVDSVDVDSAEEVAAPREEVEDCLLYT